MEDFSKEQITAFRKTISFFLRHYLFFGSIPLVVGAVFQYLALQGLGPGYSRFFSASQLLIDGLILLTIFVAIVIASFLVGAAIITFAVKEYRFIFFIVSFFFVVPGILGGEIIGEFLNDPLNPQKIFPVFIIILVIAGNIILLNRPSWIVINVMSIIYLTIGVVLAFNVMNSSIDFVNKSFSGIPEANLENIGCLLSRNGVSFEDLEVEYMNDKYLFIELQRSDGNEMVIIETATLFDFEQCGGSN